MPFANLLLVLSAAAAPLASQQAPELRSGLERAHRAEVEQRYARAAWPLGVTRAGLPVALELAGVTGETPVAEEGLLVRTFACRDGRHGGASGTPAFVLESRVADDARAAQDTLVDWLAGVQSSARMPSVAEAGLALGEVGFVGRSGARAGALAWIAFTRGNVAVRLAACDLALTPTLDLGPFALALDRAIQTTSALELGQKPARPALARLEVAARAVAGETLTLTLEGVEAGALPQWRVGGSGLGYVERARDGAWKLHTTGPGPLSVELELIGALGTTTRRTVELDVADD